MGKLLTKSRTRKQLKSAIEAALRERFVHDTVDISDGFKDNVHILVVSRQFEGMSTQQRVDNILSLLKDADLTAKEFGLISLIHALSPTELK